MILSDEEREQMIKFALELFNADPRDPKMLKTVHLVVADMILDAMQECRMIEGV